MDLNSVKPLLDFIYFYISRQFDNLIYIDIFNHKSIILREVSPK